MSKERRASRELVEAAKLKIELDKQANRRTPQFFLSVERSGYYYDDELDEASRVMERQENEYYRAEAARERKQEELEASRFRAQQEASREYERGDEYER